VAVAGCVTRRIMGGKRAGEVVPAEEYRTAHSMRKMMNVRGRGARSARRLPSEECKMSRDAMGVDAAVSTMSCACTAWAVGVIDALGIYFRYYVRQYEARSMSFREKARVRS